MDCNIHLSTHVERNNPSRNEKIAAKEEHRRKEQVEYHHRQEKFAAAIRPQDHRSAKPMNGMNHVDTLNILNKVYAIHIHILLDSPLANETYELVEILHIAVEGERDADEPNRHLCHRSVP
ncbi:uncharacterized protein LOC129748150 [Uranotaenia lowii]|uniref:uncharacterized protein LOC129748150 n=1 Tax=Uranotaenia lowii TaxID=190385 RepID=UPI00247A7CB1|nr:uncharacterized protein LOC129748150 [Uranotaenia lowii]